EYKALVKNFHNRKIKALRSDNGGEYTSQAFAKFSWECSILYEKTTPYSLEQNRVSERANHILVGRAKVMILDHPLPDEVWAEAIHTAVYLKNQSPTVTKSTTPYELWTGQRPNLFQLIPFSTPAFYHITKAKRSKWETSGEKCTVVGNTGTNQYRVMIGGKILVAQDIRVVKEVEKKVVEE